MLRVLGEGCDGAARALHVTHSRDPVRLPVCSQLFSVSHTAGAHSRLRKEVAIKGRGGEAGLQ